MKSTPKRYTTEEVEAIAAKLRAMPPVEKKKQDHSKQETIKLLSKEIVSLQKRGYTLEQIAESLCGEGIDIITPTLKSYLQRVKTKTKKPAKKAQTVVQAAKGQATFTPAPDTEDI
jgi:methionine synthase II (cobalamin-independent)